MLSTKSFTTYAQENLGYDNHDLVLLNDKFKKPKIHNQYLEWQKSLKTVQSFKKMTHYNLPPV